MWFDGKAEEAAKFYVSVFKDSRITQITHYTGEEPSGMKGQVMTVDFELDGEQFVALNGGPQFKFTEAISFVIKWDSQEEIDYYWEKLTADGGEEVQCGWLEDNTGSPGRCAVDVFCGMGERRAGLQRVMHELMQMTKLDLASCSATIGNNRGLRGFTDGK